METEPSHLMVIHYRRSASSDFDNIVISNTLTAPAGNLDIAGNFTNDGTFIHNNGTVTFNGNTVFWFIRN